MYSNHRGRSGWVDNSIEQHLKNLLERFLAEYPYNSITPFYWAFSDMEIPIRFGFPCVWQSMVLARFLHESGAENVYLLRDNRHLATVAQFQDREYLFDPYLLHTAPIDLSLLMEDADITVDAYPIRIGNAGAQKPSKLQVIQRSNSNVLRLRYSQLDMSKQKYTLSRYFDLDRKRKLPSDLQIDIKSMTHLLFHPEQTTLSIRLLHPVTLHLVQLFYPISEKHGDAKHSPESLVYTDNNGRYTNAICDGSAIPEVHEMARLLNVPSDDLISFFMTGVYLYERYAPSALN